MDGVIQPHSHNYSKAEGAERRGEGGRREQTGGQTTVGDRLQPSLTAPSMFNAVGQRVGRGGGQQLEEASEMLDKSCQASSQQLVGDSGQKRQFKLEEILIWRTNDPGNISACTPVCFLTPKKP